MNKSYEVPDHVKKILWSLPSRFIPKVTAIQEAKDLNKLVLKNLICSPKSHEIELVRDEPAKKSKSIALKFKGKFPKALQTVESEEKTPNGDSEDSSAAEEMEYLSKRFQVLKCFEFNEIF
jgi:hypothetical protein